MTREDLIDQRANTCRHGGHCEWVACDKCNHYEPDALSQQPCDDCISREAVLDALHLEGRPTKRFDYFIAVNSDIVALPSVTPKEKTGHWKRNETIRLTYCSECGFGQHIKEYRAYNYCPNCGARMVRE